MTGGVRQWIGPRRPTMLDVMGGVAAAVVICGLTALLIGNESALEGTHALDPFGYLLVALGGAALTLRTVAPLSTFAFTLAFGVAYQGIGYPGGPAPLSIVIALFTLAAVGSRARAQGLGLLAIVVLVGVRALAVPDPLSSPLLIAFPTTVVAALYSGQLLASRNAQRRELVRRAEAQQTTQEAETRRRIDAERMRIARELHDVVAHNISLINVQATMGLHLISDDPPQAAGALSAIKHASKQTLGELRRILDVLRQVDEAEPTDPTPGLDDLAAMLVTTNAAGLPVEITVAGDRRPLPASIDVTAYRIVQESLTNALRYAAPAKTRVTLHYQPRALTIDIHDEGRDDDGQSPPAGLGHGIAGMRERASAVGGTLGAGHTDDGGYLVHAELPLGPVAR